MKKSKPQVSYIIGTLLAVTTLAFSIGTATAQKKRAAGYYAESAAKRTFNPFPNDTGRSGNKAWLVRNFGPVWIGINLKRPGMTMEISNVEKGSPAEGSGKLK